MVITDVLRQMKTLPALERESVYYFWTRTIPHSWLSAWEIEKQRLERKKPLWLAGRTR